MTATAPLLSTHFKRTWTGVAPILAAAAATGASTGPPGFLVMGLHERMSMKKIGQWKGYSR